MFARPSLSSSKSSHIRVGQPFHWPELYIVPAICFTPTYLPIYPSSHPSTKPSNHLRATSMVPQQSFLRYLWIYLILRKFRIHRTAPHCLKRVSLLALFLLPWRNERKVIIPFVKCRCGKFRPFWSLVTNTQSIDNRPQIDGQSTVDKTQWWTGVLHKAIQSRLCLLKDHGGISFLIQV